MPVPVTLAAAQLEELRARMDTDGYFDVAAAALAGNPHYAGLVARLGAAVRLLVARGWPASFAVLLDDSWRLVRLLSEVIVRATARAHVLQLCAAVGWPCLSGPGPLVGGVIAARACGLAFPHSRPAGDAGGHGRQRVHDGPGGLAHRPQRGAGWLHAPPRQAAR